MVVRSTSHAQPLQPARVAATRSLDKPTNRGSRFVPVNGDRLRVLRLDRGWTQANLAEKAGYSERLIRKAESGGSLSLGSIRDIAMALSTLDQLITEKELTNDILAAAMVFMRSYDQHSEEMLHHCRHLLTDDFVFYCPDDGSGVPFIGTWCGRRGFQEFLDRFFAMLTRKPDSLDVRYSIGEDHVVARFSDCFYFHGHPIPPFYTNFHFQFRDGLICRIDDEYDTFAAAAALKTVKEQIERESENS